MQLQEESDMEEESRKSFAQITLYNQLIKEMDDLYRVYAKNCNLSETAFWILYCIREREEEAFTQREICGLSIACKFSGSFVPYAFVILCRHKFIYSSEVMRLHGLRSLCQFRYFFLE